MVIAYGMFGLFANLALMAGIALGGYWAYITLSFGGYWAWDPVENSSLVPWIIAIAAVHSMIIQKKSGRGHKAALFLSLLAFMLVFGASAAILHFESSPQSNILDAEDATERTFVAALTNLGIHARAGTRGLLQERFGEAWSG